MIRLVTERGSERISERLCRLGAALGGWNDDRHGQHQRMVRCWRWRVLDRIAGLLYVAPERRRTP